MTARGPARLLAWAALGAVSVPALWYAWSLPGIAVMFAAIGAAFLMWYRLGQRGSWMALVVLGLGMGGLLAWQAATGTRCPAGDSKVFLKENKPPVGCTDVRAGAASMSAVFLLLALVGIASPFYARGLRDPDDVALDAAAGQ